MSLMSLISSNSSSTASSTSTSTLTPLQQLIATNTSSAKATSSAGTTTSGVSISAAAKIAAAEAADNAKDFTALGTEVRATLDAQYAAAKAAGTPSAKPDLSEMSGRALAAIALNKSGGFSSTEVAAAKTELRTRTREQFTATVGTGSGAALSGIAAYNQQLVSQYDGMSSEERQALGWTSNFRASAASFVGTSSQTSLFDQLGDIGDASDY